MLASLALAALPLVQAGGPPVTAPNGGRLHLVDVDESGPAPLILASESAPFGGPVTDLHVFGMDAAGNLGLASSLSGGVGRAYGIGDGFLIAEDQGRRVRVYRPSGPGWAPDVALLPGPLLGTFIDFGKSLDVDGTRVAHRLPGASVLEIRVDDLSVPGAVNTEALIPLPQGHAHIGLSLGGDTLVAASGVYPASAGLWFTDIRVRVFERSAASGWTQVGNDLLPPAGLQWGDGAKLSVATSGGRVAVSGPVCGAVHLYERAGGAGSYALADTVRSSRQVEIGNGFCRSVDQVALRGDELVLTSGMDGAGERFLRSPAAVWTPAETARTDRGTSSPYQFAGQYLVSAANSEGVQVHDRTSPATGLEIACPAPPSAEPMSLFVSAPGTHGPDPFAVDVAAVSTEHRILLVAGVQPGTRVIGPEGVLCIGGPLRALPLSTLAPGFGRLEVDPVAAGLAPGTTLYLQGWQRLPAPLLVRSSAAVAITLAP